jgi:hypothetical protein
MTANREPSNQSFEIDREATVCTASRRFLPFCPRRLDQHKRRAAVGCSRRPWSVEELDACFVVRDHSGQALAYIYFEAAFPNLCPYQAN